MIFDERQFSMCSFCQESCVQLPSIPSERWNTLQKQRNTTIGHSDVLHFAINCTRKIFQGRIDLVAQQSRKHASIHLFRPLAHFISWQVDLDSVRDYEAGTKDDRQGLTQAVEAGVVRAPRREGLHESDVEQGCVGVHELVRHANGARGRGKKGGSVEGKEGLPVGCPPHSRFSTDAVERAQRPRASHENFARLKNSVSIPGTKYH